MFETIFQNFTSLLFNCRNVVKTTRLSMCRLFIMFLTESNISNNAGICKNHLLRQYSRHKIFLASLDWLKVPQERWFKVSKIYVQVVTGTHLLNINLLSKYLYLNSQAHNLHFYKTPGQSPTKAMLYQEFWL